MRVTSLASGVVWRVGRSRASNSVEVVQSSDVSRPPVCAVLASRSSKSVSDCRPSQSTSVVMSATRVRVVERVRPLKS